MPKTTDVVGTIRIPEAGYGRFWNFMRTMPGGEFTPTLEAESPAAKRTHGKTKEGSTGKCIVLAYLCKNAVATPATLGNVIVAAGKKKASLGNVLHELVKAGRLKNGKGGYSITVKGRAFHEANCPQQ